MKYFTLTGESKGEIYKELKKQYGDKAYIIKIISEEIEEKAPGLFKKMKVRQIYKAYCGVIESEADLEKAKKFEEKKTAVLKQKETVALPLYEKNQPPALETPRKDYEKISNEMEELKSMFARIIENQVDEEVVEENIQVIQEIKDYFWKNDFSFDFSDEFLASLKVPVFNLDTFKVILKEKIRLSLNFCAGFQSGSGRFISFFGPSGCGKTTVLFKLAALYLLNEKKKIRFFTFDSYRLGGAKQIELYANVLECPYHMIQSENDLKTALKEVKEEEVVFMDTPSEGFHADSRYLEINRLISLIPEKVNRVFVCAANGKTKDFLQLKEKFEKINYDYYLITKLDETLTVGPILSLLYKDSKPTAYLTAGPSVPEDIQKADIERILALLI